MIRTQRRCPTGRTPRDRCTGTLSEAVAQAGEHAGRWVEACFVCGYTKPLSDEDAARAAGMETR